MFDLSDLEQRVEDTVIVGNSYWIFGNKMWKDHLIVFYLQFYDR